MLLRLVLALALGALALLPGVARGQEPLLLARVGPDTGLEISFTHADGTPVTRLEPGTYRIQVTTQAPHMTSACTGRASTWARRTRSSGTPP